MLFWHVHSSLLGEHLICFLPSGDVRKWIRHLKNVMLFVSQGNSYGKMFRKVPARAQAHVQDSACDQESCGQTKVQAHRWLSGCSEILPPLINVQCRGWVGVHKLLWSILGFAHALSEDTKPKIHMRSLPRKLIGHKSNIKNECLLVTVSLSGDKKTTA